jgi:hypothetical protein
MILMHVPARVRPVPPQASILGSVGLVGDLQDGDSFKDIDVDCVFVQIIS